MEADHGENLVGVGVGEEADGGDAAEGVGAADGHGGEVRRRGGLLGVALWEVVDEGTDGGNLAGAGDLLPDAMVDRHYKRGFRVSTVGF